MFIIYVSHIIIHTLADFLFKFGHFAMILQSSWISYGSHKLELVKRGISFLWQIAYPNLVHKI